MRVLVKYDVEKLRSLLAEKRTKWNDWEFRLYRNNIIVYVPIVPKDPKTGKPDPADRYKIKHLKIVPEPGGPFRLEYMRHTDQWWPFQDAVGNIQNIANFIEKDPYGLCNCFSR
ncbi:MAG: hypothetical protein ACYTF1_11595 [Planctomycetota bacterium]|jgi:hypothetical protein